MLYFINLQIWTQNTLYSGLQNNEENRTSKVVYIAKFHISQIFSFCGSLNIRYSKLRFSHWQRRTAHNFLHLGSILDFFSNCKILFSNFEKKTLKSSGSIWVFRQITPYFLVFMTASKIFSFLGLCNTYLNLFSQVSKQSFGLSFSPYLFIFHM
jgi:hypothetical protein